MKLYFSPGACSLSPHIVLFEGGFQFEAEKVDLRSKKTASGKDFNAINEKGYVPFLVLDSGETLTEGPAIVQYLADQKPDTKLAPKPGTVERAYLMEWLNFISTELHKSFSPLFSPIDDKATEFFRMRIAKRLDYVNSKLQGKNYLMGEQFTVADAYLYTVVRWTRLTKIDLSKWTALTAYMERVAARPHVKEALKAEGL